MMVDDTENNEFRELLSGYAEPISDDGFSDHVLMQATSLQKMAPQNTSRIKNIMVGGAAILAAFIALPQVGKLVPLLGKLVGGVKLPELSLPSNLVDTASMPNMTIIALLAVLIVGIASSFLFSSNL